MKTFHLGKATDLYDCGTATFGIAKENIQSVEMFSSLLILLYINWFSYLSWH
jgi:hypothetical protein